MSEVTRALAERAVAARRPPLGRSLAVFHVGTGGCGGCAMELRALASPAYDLARHGIAFVETPREANVLLVSGPVPRAIAAALALAWDAAPEPKWVVAVGDCAIDGGVFRGGYADGAGTGAMLPVDLAIPGSPPAPDQTLAGLRALADVTAGD